jgi:hypothetical protein
MRKIVFSNIWRSSSNAGFRESGRLGIYVLALISLVLFSGCGMWGKTDKPEADTPEEEIVEKPQEEEAAAPAEKEEQEKEMTWEDIWRMKIPNARVFKVIQVDEDLLVIATEQYSPLEVGATLLIQTHEESPDYLGDAKVVRVLDGQAHAQMVIVESRMPKRGDLAIFLPGASADRTTE